MRGTHIVLEGIDGAGTTHSVDVWPKRSSNVGDVHQTGALTLPVGKLIRQALQKRSSGNQLRWHWPLLWIDWTTFSEKSSQRWPRVRLYCLTATLFRA